MQAHRPGLDDDELRHRPRAALDAGRCGVVRSPVVRIGHSQTVDARHRRVERDRVAGHAEDARAGGRSCRCARWRCQDRRGARELVDREVRGRRAHQRDARHALLEQLRLGARGRIELVVRQQHVAHPHRPQPVAVERRRDGPAAVVRQVLRAVGVLAVPPARERNPALRQEVRLGVAPRRDDLDAEVGRALGDRPQEVERRQPERRGLRLVRVAADGVLDQRDRLPGDRHREGERDQQARPEAAQRRDEREQGQRDVVEQPRRVAAERGGVQLRRPAEREVREEDPDERAGAGVAAREQRAAEREARDAREIEQRVGEGPAGRERAEHEQLAETEQRDRAHGREHAGLAQDERAPLRGHEADERDPEQQERERAREQAGQAAEDEQHGVPALHRDEGRERERAAERERVLGGDQHARPERGEQQRREARGRSPLPQHRRGEQPGTRDDRDHGDGQVPDQGRERIVERAVVDELVAAGVPVVVPEPPAVARERRRQVLVRRAIDAGRPEQGERKRQHRRDGERDRHVGGDGADRETARLVEAAWVQGARGRGSRGHAVAASVLRGRGRSD